MVLKLECWMCGEKLRPTLIEKSLLESEIEYYKRAGNEIEKDLNSNFWVYFTYWNKNKKIKRMLCRDCSVKVAKYIENKRIN